MKLVVFGATGGTGRQVVEQALDAGHEVTAVVRDAARMPVRHERLRVVKADVFESAQIGPALAGVDAVISALGPRSYRASTTVCSRGVGSILEAMRATGVRRFVCVSAAPVARAGKGDGLLYRVAIRPLLWTVFKGAYDDMTLMEAWVRRSDVDWTIFRPPQLTDNPRTGRYRTAVGGNGPGGYRISRADLADAILHSLDDPGSIKAAVGVGY